MRVLIAVAVLAMGTAVYAGEPGIEARVSQAFGSAPVEAPQSVRVQTPGPQVQVEAESPGLLGWIGQGLGAVLDFAVEWGVDKPVNVTHEGLVAAQKTVHTVKDGTVNVTRAAVD